MKKTTLSLLAVYGGLQLLLAWMYFQYPEGMPHVSEGIASFLRQLGGVPATRGMSVTGARLALAMAVSYIPGVIVGAMFLLLEARSVPVRRRAWEYVAFIAALLLLLAVLQYAVYWAIPYRDRISMQQLVLPALTPLLAGFLVAAIALTAWKLFDRRTE